MLIKIKRDTIKPNPRAGERRTVFAGKVGCNFKIKGKIPLGFENEVVITSSGSGTLKGLLIDYKKQPDFLLACENQGITASTELCKNLQTTEHAPLPKYIYKYEDPKVKCDSCYSQVPVSHIDSDFIDFLEHSYEHTICPECGAHNTFPDLEYEDINDALKND